MVISILHNNIIIIERRIYSESLGKIIYYILLIYECIDV